MHRQSRRETLAPEAAGRDFARRDFLKATGGGSTALGVGTFFGVSQTKVQ